jgi:tetratricopeptide (TPR) repeat protein
MARWDLEDVAGAQAACDKGLLVAPGMAELWLHDGYCKAALGRFAEAAESYRKALALKPSIEEARLALIQAGFREESRVEINHLQRVLEDPDREEFQRTAAAFALGKLFDDDGDYDAAFAAFATGNRLVRSSNEIKGRGFDRAADDAHVRGLIAMFSPSVFQVTAGLGSPSELPVFVVGMPRSGTTLVEQILSSHSDVVGAGELDDVASIAARLAGGRKHLPLYEWRRSDVTREATNYVKKLGDVGVTAWRVVDKMPGNMQWLGHIAVLFPRARVIICRRDPRDVCLSCYFQHFGDKLSWSTDLGDLAAYAQSFDRLAAHWRSALPIRMLEVQYEDLVNDLETGSRRIIDFLGLEWDPACLSFHETERTVMTASQWQVRQPLYTSSVGRWRLYRKHLGPLLDGLRGLLLPEGDDPHQQHKTDGLSIDDLLQGGRVLTGGSVGAV